MQASPLIDSELLDGALAKARDPFPILRETLQEGRAELERRYRAGEAISDLVRQHADAVDAILSRVWRLCMGVRQSGPALVAVGGYGRG